MSYQPPTLEELHAFLVAFWKFLYPLSKVQSRFTYHWKRLRAYAGGVTDLSAGITSAIADVMPDTSAGAFLTRWGKIVGVVKKGATGARGTNALQVIGQAGSPVTTGMQLQHPATGMIFQINETVTMPAAGFVNVDVAAISTGAATRLLAGTALQFTSSNPGLQAIAKIVVDLTTDGFDAEQDPAYSKRVNAEFGEPRMGGHDSDFVKWMLEIAGIATAYCYPNRAGIGTVDVVGFHAGSGSSRSLTTAEIAAALAYLKTKTPAQLGGLAAGLRVLSTTAVPITVDCTVTTNGDNAYAWDWDDTAAPVLLSFNATTNTAVFAASLPSSLLASARCVFKGVGSVQDGRVFTADVISTTTNPNDTITFREKPSVAFVATDIMYAGGPLTNVVRDALLAHLNGEIVYADKGQAIGESTAVAKGKALARLNVLVPALGPANPLGAYGTWTGDILVANLAKIATYATGVRNASFPAIPSDLLLADTIFPNDAATNFVTPNAIIVRKA